MIRARSLQSLLSQEAIASIVRAGELNRVLSWRTGTARLFPNALPPTVLDVADEHFFVCQERSASYTQSPLVEAVFVEEASNDTEQDAVLAIGPNGLSGGFLDVLSFYPPIARCFMSGERPALPLMAAATLAAFGVRRIAIEPGFDWYDEPGTSRFLSAFEAAFPGAALILKDLPSRPISSAAPNTAGLAHEAASSPVDLAAIIQDIARVREDALTHKAHANALRGSTSFRVGNAIVRPAFALRELLGGKDRRASEATVRGPVSILVICHETSSITGSHRPAVAYVEEMRRRGASVHLIDLQRFDRTRQAVKAFPDADIILVNSIAPLMWRCVRDLMEARQDGVFLYAHETEWVLRRFSDTHPAEYGFLRKVAPRIPILCVSNDQKRLFETRYGASNVCVVRNVTTNANSDPQKIRTATRLDPKPQVLMVGSIQARKGPELFSMVADLAEERGRPWIMRWVGGGHQDDLYQSQAVDWVGPLRGEDLTQAYRTASLFFLPSADDPFPLSALEALSFGLGVVCSRNVGTAEITSDLRGSAFFEHYTAEHAFAAIDRSLSEGADPSANFERAKIYADPSYFADVLNRAIGVDALGSSTAAGAQQAR